MLFTQTGPCFGQDMSVGTFHSRGQGVGEKRRVSQSGGGGGLTQHPLYHSRATSAHCAGISHAVVQLRGAGIGDQENVISSD